MTKFPSRIKKLAGAVGPGVITGAADDDPSGIGTYSMAGAQFGSSFLWLALASWPLMTSVQMQCARVGMVTGKGLGAALTKKFPRWMVVVFCFFLFVANTLNVGADLAAMADAIKLLTGWPSQLLILVLAGFITWVTVFWNYAKLANTLKWLCLCLLAYIAVTFMVKIDWPATFHDTFVPHFPSNHDEWGVVVAVLGTTISPYLFFWQASQEVEEEKSRGRKTLEARRGATPEEIQIRQYDISAGTFFSNVVMYFIILAAASTLHKAGITQIESSSQAAEALKPFAGAWAEILYCVGIVGVGLLAIPTLTGATAYALADTLSWRQGLDMKPEKARPFYWAIIVSTVVAVGMDMVNFNPIQALYVSALVNGVLAPFCLFGLWIVIRDNELMQKQPSPALSQILVALTTIIMFFAMIMMFR